MPLYIKPEKKLSVHDVMHLMRDHYQGTELDMTVGVAAGPYDMPYRWRPLTWQYEGEEYLMNADFNSADRIFICVTGKISSSG